MNVSKFKFACCLFVFALFSASLPAASQVAERKHIRYVDRVQSSASSTTPFINQPLALKSNRVSAKRGEIVLMYDEDLPDSIKTAFTMAKELWESKIVTKQPIYIWLVFEPLDKDISIASEVSYYMRGTDVAPLALASQIYDFQKDDNDIDGMVIFNTEIDWNCSFSTNIAQEYNLPTMALRGIARCLGFGTSLYESSTDIFKYNLDFPSIFDKLLRNTSDRLSNIEAGSVKMKTFVTSNDVVAETPTMTYKVYAPSAYKPDFSLLYLDEVNSLMSYSLSQGNISLDIDNATIDILKAMGWDLPVSGLKILCEDISDNGIGSAYSPHSFSLDRGTASVSDYKWTFSLKDKSGAYTVVAQGVSETFVIDKVGSPQDYHVNLNGDIEGRIECEYTLNGKRFTASPFALSLELKPAIISIDNIETIREANYYILNCSINYMGADNLTVEVEEEYNSAVRCYTFDEPFRAHVKTGKVTSHFYSWVTFVVSNKYGSAYETLEFPPVFNRAAIEELGDSDAEVVTGGRIQLIDLTGAVIYDGDAESFSLNGFNPGIYVKHVFINGGSKTSKIVVP